MGLGYIVFHSLESREEAIVIEIRDKEGNLIRIELSKWEQLILARKNNELLRKQKNDKK